MNITSYNITDVGYHYIGLRVLAGLPSTAQREEQTSTISRSVRKYAMDKALRLMLPEPRGTFDTAGGKICQELVHLEFARSANRAYELTDSGKGALRLLENRRYQELRRIMVEGHLKTYDNLRMVVLKHLQRDGVWRPVVETSRAGDSEYITHLLEPTFGEEAEEQAIQLSSDMTNTIASQLEDKLRNSILGKAFSGVRVSESLFKSMCNRLVSLRLLNLTKSERQGCEFDKSYTPCVASSPTQQWYTPLDIRLKSGDSFTIYICEPDMSDPETQTKLLCAIHSAFSGLRPTAGYYNLPDVRDTVCEHIKIPEAAFDEGLNCLLDLNASPFTMGLQYEGISGRRKPFIRDSGSVQIYNLIRSA